MAAHSAPAPPTVLLYSSVISPSLPDLDSPPDGPFGP